MPPRIPRESWSSHPHYPSQVLLLGSHQNFRRTSAYLVSAAEAKHSVADINRHYTMWISGMRSHEGYEEHKLYPYLRYRFGISFDKATQGHQKLHQADDNVRGALRASGEWGSEQYQRLAWLLRIHDSILDEHLTLEEDLVIPALLELSPQEFREYTNGSIDTLLPRTS